MINDFVGVSLEPLSGSPSFTSLRALTPGIDLGSFRGGAQPRHKIKIRQQFNRIGSLMNFR
jgi:hypothetical protein